MCRWVRARTRHASRATIRSSRSIGSLPARPRRPTLYPESNRLDRIEALRLYTVGSSWFSVKKAKKARLPPANSPTWRCFRPIIFQFQKSRLSNLNRCLTIVGGKVVYATREFSSSRRRRCPSVPMVARENYGGYWRPVLKRPNRHGRTMRRKSRSRKIVARATTRGALGGLAADALSDLLERARRN